MYKLCTFNTFVFTCTHYSLSSITAVSLYGVNPPNTIIQLVVGVVLHNERE